MQTLFYLLHHYFIAPYQLNLNAFICGELSVASEMAT